MPSFRIRRFKDARAFFEHSQGFLLEREAEHNLILGILSGLIEHPERFKKKPLLMTVEAQGEIQAVGLRAPPHNLVLSLFADLAALEPLAQDLKSERLPGVLGPGEAARRFAELWRARTQQDYQLHMAERIYRLTRVRHPGGVPGRFRRAEAKDSDLLVAWVQAFLDEATPGSISLAPEEIVTRRLEDGLLYLWEDEGQAVALAGAGGPTPHGIRIGPVYTPPEYRRRGYASACVASLSQKLLDEGRSYCFLFTDLANPTSNHIYQRIGYEGVCDVDEYRFMGSGA